MSTGWSMRPAARWSVWLVYLVHVALSEGGDLASRVARHQRQGGKWDRKPRHCPTVCVGKIVCVAVTKCIIECDLVVV